MPSRRRGRLDRHVRLVRLTRIALPVAGLLLIAALLIAPSFSEKDAGFTLSMSEIREFDDRLRMTNPRFKGTDDKNRVYTIAADSAYQERAKAEEIVLSGINADVALAGGGWLSLQAPAGIFRPEKEQAEFSGQVNLYSDWGYEVHAKRIQIDLPAGLAQSDAGIFGQGPLGTFKAGSMQALLDDKVLVLQGRVQMTLYPRAVRLEREGAS